MVIGKGEREGTALHSRNWCGWPRPECLYGLLRAMKRGETNEFRGLFSDRMAMPKQANKCVRRPVDYFLNSDGSDRSRISFQHHRRTHHPIGRLFRWSGVFLGCPISAAVNNNRMRKDRRRGGGEDGRTPAITKWFVRERGSIDQTL